MFWYLASVGERMCVWCQWRPGYHGWPPPSQSVTSPPGELGSAGTGPPAHTADSAAVQELQSSVQEITIQHA